MRHFYPLVTNMCHTCYCGIMGLRNAVPRGTSHRYHAHHQFGLDCTPVVVDRLLWPAAVVHDEPAFTLGLVRLVGVVCISVPWRTSLTPGWRTPNSCADHQWDSMKIKGKRKKLAPGLKDLLDYPAIGMWADREDMKDVHAWLRKIRTPRYLRDDGTLFSPPSKLRQARVRIDPKGRVVIPASIREALGIKSGDEVELRIEDNELRVSTLKTRLARAQQRLRKFIKPGRSLARELIAERREAARHE